MAEVPAYWGAQTVGAVLGALGIWALFSHSAIDLGMGQTSFNEDTTTWASAIFAEGIGTFMLMYAILGIVDSRSPGDFAGLIIGGVVVAIIMVVGPVTGASLNPARAFGPELRLGDRQRRDALEPAHRGLRPARAWSAPRWRPSPTTS